MGQIMVDCEFPGGNIVVESIDGTTVKLHQDLRDNSEWWFYWYFRIRGAAGKTVRFVFTGGDVFGAMGPLFSLDGRAWHWLGREILEGDSFAYSFPISMNEAYFSFGFPYVESDWRTYLQGKQAIQEKVLTVSEKGRKVEEFHMPSQTGRYKMLITARHHACEGMANYVLEGMWDEFLGNNDDARLLREHMDVHIVPFVDIDGVEAGDQGKMRSPHDHWDDYSDTPIYKSTRAIMEQSPTWRGEFWMVLDLHCPAMRGGIHDEIFVVEPEPQWMDRLNDFDTFLEATSQASIPFDRRKSIAYGDDWNVAGPNCPDYFRNRQNVFAITLEFPYALAGGVIVTADNARSFGHALSRAVLLDFKRCL